MKMLYGKMKDGTEIHLHELTNGFYTVGLLDIGAGIAYVKAPDAKGRIETVTLTYPDLDSLLGSTAYMGLTVGRFANRIARSSFSLGQKSFKLQANDGRNSLHGGYDGIAFKVFSSTYFEMDGNLGIRFSYHSPDNEAGYPGNMDIEVDYVLFPNGRLSIGYSATADKACPVNLCNHAYFALGGQDKGRVQDIELVLACSSYLPVDSELIPTGQMQDVEGTDFDFTSPRLIGDKRSGAYDHCFCVDGWQKEIKKVRPIALAVDRTSGRTLKVWTSMPAVQLYTGEYLGREGYHKSFSGFCLETQYYPDSPNRENFPSCILQPGKLYEQSTILDFGVTK